MKTIFARLRKVYGGAYYGPGYYTLLVLTWAVFVRGDVLTWRHLAGGLVAILAAAALDVRVRRCRRERAGR